MVAQLVEDGDPDLFGELVRVGKGLHQRAPEDRDPGWKELVLLVEAEEPGLGWVGLPDDDGDVLERRGEVGRQVVERLADGLFERGQPPRPSRMRPATEAISSVAPVTSLSSASALGPWPSDHSSRSSPPASRFANQSLPNVSRRYSRSCASNAHERR